MANDAWTVLTPVATEPISLTDAKGYLRVDFPDDDVVIANLISRARSFAETVTGRAFATQKIQQVFSIARPEGGELSGPINRGPSWYAYQQQIGANPFGAAQFFFDIAMPPFQTSQAFTLETKVVAFDPWVTFPQITNADGSVNIYVDNVQEPARLYMQDPLTVNFWRVTFWAGYDAVQSYALPWDLKQPLLETISYWYDNREADDLPDAILKKFMAKRVANAWI